MKLAIVAEDIRAVLCLAPCVFYDHRGEPMRWGSDGLVRGDADRRYRRLRSVHILGTKKVIMMQTRLFDGLPACQETNDCMQT